MAGHLTQSPCKLVSELASESLVGTAGQVVTWILVEYPGIFGAHAWEDAAIPANVKEAVNKLAASRPPAKILLIRSQQTERPGKIRVFVGLSQEGSSPTLLLMAERKDYEDFLELQSLDRDTLVSEGFIAFEQPLLLICTNGRRDLCCAKYSIPVYSALSKIDEVLAFECSHLGQHRYAPNLLVFPGAILYGRVELDDVLSFCQSVHAGGLSLKHLRGRSSFPHAAQAAEYFLREEGTINLGTILAVESSVETTPDHWEVIIRTETMGYMVAVDYLEDADSILTSCNGNERHTPRRFVLKTIEPLGVLE